MFIGILIAVISYLLSPLVGSFFGLKDDSEFRFLVQVMGISTGISFQTAILVAVLVAHEKHTLQSSLEILVVLVRATLMVAALSQGLGLAGLALAFLISAVLEMSAYLVGLKARLPWIALQFKLISPKVLSRLLAFGFPTFLLIIFWQMRTNFDSLIIGNILGVEQVAIYGIAALLIRYASRVAMVGAGVFAPRFSRIVGKANNPVPLFRASLFFGTTITLPVAFSLLLFGGHFIELWVGSAFSDAAVVLWILVASYSFSMAQQSNLAVMMAINKHSTMTYIACFEGVLNVVLSIILATRFGIIGVAVGTALPMLIVKALVEPIIVSCHLKISLYQYATPILLSMVFSSPFLILFVVFGIGDTFFSSSWIGLFLGVAILSLTALTSAAIGAYFFSRDLLQFNTT